MMQNPTLNTIRTYQVVYYHGEFTGQERVIGFIVAIDIVAAVEMFKKYVAVNKAKHAMLVSIEDRGDFLASQEVE